MRGRQCPRVSPQCLWLSLRVSLSQTLPSQTSAGPNPAPKLQTRLRLWEKRARPSEHGATGPQQRHHCTRGILSPLSKGGTTPCQWPRIKESWSSGTTKAGRGLCKHQAQPPTLHCRCNPQRTELNLEIIRLLLIGAVFVCKSHCTPLASLFVTKQCNVMSWCCAAMMPCPATICHWFHN